MVGRSRVHIRVQADAFDTATESALFTEGRTDVGAVVAFTGLCRDEARTIAFLEIEHYPGMAEEEISRVADEAITRWPLDGLVIVHRYGRIATGEQIVLVVTASRHRDAAFKAASFLMDYMKTRAPFWKKAHRVEDSRHDWIEARSIDDAAADHWKMA